MRFCGNCGTRLVQTAASLPSGEVVEQGAMIGANLRERFLQAGLEAAGQRRDVTVMFVDLANYTGLSTQMDTEEVYYLIQQYARLLANQVYKYEGMVDKYTGDGLMALFGAPIAHENNAERAVRAALDMQVAFEKLRAQVFETTGNNLKMRIGLHSGPVIVGQMGADLMMDYTAIGDTAVLRRALEYAATCNLAVHLFCEDGGLRNDGVIHEGMMSVRLGLPGIPETAETIAVSRVLLLIEHTGTKVHFCRISSARSLELIAQAGFEPRSIPFEHSEIEPGTCDVFIGIKR